MDKASTDGGIALLAFAFAGKLAGGFIAFAANKYKLRDSKQSSITTSGKLAGGLGLSFANEGQRWRGAADIQPYRKPTHSAAKHPNPAAEATDAAEAIIRDYGITN